MMAEGSDASLPSTVNEDDSCIAQYIEIVPLDRTRVDYCNEMDSSIEIKQEPVDEIKEESVDKIKEEPIEYIKQEIEDEPYESDKHKELDESSEETTDCKAETSTDNPSGLQHKCRYCKKIFLQPEHLRLHLLWHTTKRDSTHPTSRMAYATKARLGKFKVTAGKGPFTCHICEKQLYRAQSFLMHMDRHTGDQPYSCEICQKKFSLIGHLNRHQNVPERPYSCHVCCRKFALPSSLRSHMITHADVAYYTCRYDLT